MNLPFTPAQFFALFTAYNEAVWPAQLLLLALAVAMVLLVQRRPAAAGRVAAAGLALFWAWLGIAYHLVFFWRINPAAPLFAGISLFAAAAFVWWGVVQGRLHFEPLRGARHVAGLAVIAFALAIYPAIGALLGHHYPAAPTFGLPCPTTLYTFGMLLLAAPGFPKILVIAPLLWALIGATAAFALGVTQDLGLLVVAGAGAWLLGRRAPAA